MTTNAHSTQCKAQLYIFQDTEDVIKMIIQGRSPMMSHLSRTHRVALDWSFDRINLDPKIQIKYIDTKNQLADILTEGSFLKNESNHLLCSFNIMSFLMYSCSHFTSFLSQAKERIVIGAVTKRGQNATSNDGSPTAQARPVNLVMRSLCKETSSQSLGSRVNLENDDERKRVRHQEIGCSVIQNRKSKNSQVSRQEKVFQTTRKLVQKDQTQMKSEESPPGTSHPPWAGFLDEF